MKGIDVSYHNGYINWQKIKAAGIDFAICRSSYGKSTADSTFKTNVRNAHDAGLICGAYHYSYALTPADAKKEADFCKNFIDQCGVLLELPVFFDMEDADNYKRKRGFIFNKRNITNICRAFLDNINLNAGVYASYSWLKNYIDWSSLHCPIWNAQWSDSDSFKGFMWQFTDKLNIGGKLFDGNILYN